MDLLLPFALCERTSSTKQGFIAPQLLGQGGLRTGVLWAGGQPRSSSVMSLTLAVTPTLQMWTLRAGTPGVCESSGRLQTPQDPGWGGGAGREASEDPAFHFS